MKALRYAILIAFVSSLAAFITAIVMSTRGAAEPDTAQELADRLRANGLRFDRVESIREFAWEESEITEGLALRGTDLFIEILRIEDPKSFAAAEAAGSKFAALQGGIEWEPVKTPEIFARRPYIVVIREEPERGQIAAILHRLLPNQIT